MSDFDLPDLPSDEELGITDEDREKYGDDLPDDGPELTDEEMAALLGGTTPPPIGSRKDESPSSSGAARKERKKRAKEEKRRAKAAKKAEAARAKEARKAEAARAKEAKGGERADAGGGVPTPAPIAPGAAGDGPSDPGSGGAGEPTEVPRTGGPAPLAAMPAWRGPVTLLAMMALSVFASSRTGQVDPMPAGADESEFSSARAMSLVEDMAREAHPPGSPEHERVRGFLLDRLRQLGLEPEVQTATSLLERRGATADAPSVARAATVRNVVARIRGSNPSGTVLVTAHYDSRGLAPGAGDDASGVASILEALRALGTGPTLRNDIIVLFTDAEELGLLGARAFVDEHPWMPDVDLVLSFEMRGGGGPSIMFETNDRNGWVVRALRDFDPHPFAYSMSYEVYERMPRDTDFTPFKEAGVQGLNFAAIDNAHVYHQVYDTPANLSPSTLQHHGIHALSGLRYFANADLTSVNDSNVVFFSVPGLGLVVYDRIWVLVISLVLVGLFVLLVLAGRRAGARLGRIAVGTLVATLAIAFTYFAANWAFAALVPLHPEYGALQGAAFHAEGWYLLGLVFFAALLVVASSALVARWIAPLELAMGAVIVPLGGSVAAGFFAPLAAMHLQWPVAGAIVSVTVMALLRSRASGAVGWVVALALAVPAFALLQPVVELLWLAMSLSLAGVLAAVAGTGLFLTLPLLHSLRAPNRWWAPATFAAVSAACFATGMLTSGPTAEHPAPSTLVYAHEHGSDGALWATTPEPVADADAYAWATERASGGFADTGTLTTFGYPSFGFALAPARAVLVEPPVVEVVTDTVLGNARRAIVHVRSLIGAEMVGFHFDGETRPTSINDVPLSNVDDLGWLEHWGTPEDAVILELSLPPDAPIDLHVVEHLLRPREILGQDAFERPPELAPDISRQSDRALLRYSLEPHGDTPGGPGPDIVTPPPNTGVPDSLIEIRGDTGSRPDTASVPDTTSPTPTAAPVPPDTTSLPIDTTAGPPDAAGTRDTTGLPRPGA